MTHIGVRRGRAGPLVVLGCLVAVSRSETYSRAIRLPVGVASPYEVLGVDPDADEDEVEAAYRRCVKETHPDLGGSPREFLRIRRAYEAIVSDEADAETDLEPTEPAGRAATGNGASSSEPAGSRVEYLDYDVLADYGWSLADDDLFEKAAGADLDPDDYGRFLVKPDESLLEAAENRGFAWPYACRGGACANCAVAVLDGEMSMPVNHILPEEMLDRGVRLSCVGGPTTEEMRVVFNVKHLPDLDDLRLPPSPFEQAYRGD